MIRKHFRFKRLVLGLAIAAFAAPTAAQAMVDIGGPTGGEQAYQVQASQPIASEISVQSPTSSFQSTQSNPGPTAAGTAIANARHDALPVPTVVTSTQSDNGFSWSDAGIGASVSFGAAVLLLAALALGRRYRGRLDRSGLASA